MQPPPEKIFELDDFVPKLRQAVAQPPFDPKRMLLVAVPVKNPESRPKLEPANIDRRLIGRNDGDSVWDWEPESLSALFRGNKAPPF